VLTQHIYVTNTRSVSLVAFWLGSLFVRAAVAHDASLKRRSSVSGSSASDEQMPVTHGHPLFIGGDLGNRTLFQPGGLPMSTEDACKDEKLASRLVRNAYGESTTLLRYCQDGLDLDEIALSGSPIAEEMEDLALPSSRIVGGFRSKGTRYPYMALAFDDYSPFCAGFLIAPTWVLTAAHCVDDGIVGLKLGSDNWMIDDIVGHTYKTAKIKKMIRHDKYESAYLASNNKNLAPPADLALLQLTKPVEGVTPVKLASKADKLPKEYSVIGFGRIGEYEVDMSTVLREVKVGNVDRKKCEDAFNKELKKSGYWSKGAPTYKIDKSIICAGDNKKKEADACQGDSGGPLIRKGSKPDGSEDVVFGITSFGEGCGRKGLSGGYTNVGYYEDWIKSQMKKYGG
jgi:hypothetical protein